MNKEDLLAQAKNNLKILKDIEPKSLSRKDELGVLSLEAIVAPVSKIIEVYSRIDVAVFEEMPIKKIDIFNNNLVDILGQIDKIKNFKPDKEGNPNQLRSSLINDTYSFSRSIYDYTNEFIVYGAALNARHVAGEANKIMSEFQNKSEQLFQDFEVKIQDTMKNSEIKLRVLVDEKWLPIEKEISKTEARDKEMESHLNESKRFMSEVKKDVEISAVSKLSEYFNDAAKEDYKRANLWQWITIELLVLVGILSIYFIYGHFPIPRNMYDTIQLVTGKLIMSSAVFYILYLAGRNYLASNHNAVVNRHRKNALLTHKAMVESTVKESDRDIVLNHAASCIYSPVSTGYTGAGDQQTTPIARSVIELLGKSSGTSSV